MDFRKKITRQNKKTGGRGGPEEIRLKIEHAYFAKYVSGKLATIMIQPR